MKQVFLFFYTIILFGGEINAQSDSIANTKKWNQELGLNIYSLAINGGDFFTYYKRTASNFAFSGLNVKFYKKQNAFRLSFDHLQQIIFINGLFGSRNNLVSSRGVQFSAGYQRMFSKKKTSLFAFIDISYKSAKELRDIHSSYSHVEYYYFGSSLTWVYSSVYAASPGIGIRMNLKRNILLTLDSGAQFYYSRENTFLMRGISIKPLNVGLGFKL